LAWIDIGETAAGVLAHIRAKQPSQHGYDHAPRHGYVQAERIRVMLTFFADMVKTTIVLLVPEIVKLSVVVQPMKV